MTRLGIWSALAMLGLGVCLTGAQPAAAQIQVTGTNPSAAPQGTINLNVTIAGSGFKKGATAQWFVTGTTNPGGVTVNSTTFNSSSKLTANITVSDTATIANFDVQVTSAGRTGKGTELFAVTTKGTPIGCSTTGTPNGFTLVTVLNPVQSNGAALITTLRLGNAIRVRPLDLNGDGIVDTLVAFVTSGQTGSEGTYVFLLDPANGLPQTANPVTGAAWQNPLVLLTGAFSTVAEAGDVNGDGVPDFIMLNSLYLFVGSVSGANAVPPYTLTYTAYPIHAPAGAPSNFGTAIALGDLDGDGADEIAVGALPGKRDTSSPAVFIYKYVPGSNGGSGSVNNVQKIQDPPGTGEGFGSAIAIGNIDGLAGNELVVGAPGASTPNGGIVYVFPAPAQQSSYFSLTGPGPKFGEGLGIADVSLDGFPDLVVNTGDQFSGSDTTAQTLIFAGNVHAGETYTNLLLPATGLSYSWAAPNFDVGNMLTVGAVAVGTPNASIGTSCTSIKGGVGAVHLFTSSFASSQQPSYVFGPPTLVGSSQFSFGYGVGVVPGYPFLLVGAHLQDVGTTSNAGQVYVYKKN
jgi:FG-GAP repeat protein